MKTKEWLREKLNEKKITQKELAESIGISLNAISKILRGERFGSPETWKKIETFFGEDTEKVSYESTDLIEELKEDIEEFGENHECILVYRVYNHNIIFTNYDFIVEEKPFDPKTELEKGEKFITSTLGEALQLFEDQNRLI